VLEIGGAGMNPNDLKLNKKYWNSKLKQVYSYLKCISSCISPMNTYHFTCIGKPEIVLTALGVEKYIEDPDWLRKQKV
jgi:hypothetical protein